MRYPANEYKQSHLELKMQSGLIRNTFFEFFKGKGHKIVKSAPMVLKNDPTLMFTNAGMNQFKDLFLGNEKSDVLRIANTQKCLRVSGKHNDLEEVGVDTYHHTMFEMLGNWSFGDYFKQEAIDWAYELLVDVYGIDKNLLYVSYFSGDKQDGLSADEEARSMWLKYFPEERILGFGKKDNFWEMGETGPCGPCSEIHIDLRSDEEKKEIDGAKLVNESHPQVIEIWNLVFMEFNRSKDQSLKELPNKHVDTGMGLERLAMVLQGKTSNYDTDIFMSLIKGLENRLKNIEYTHSKSKSDIAFRVIVDHMRAVSISIAEGQLPFNTGAGYVIRRILRRAIRYAYSFLNVREPIIYALVPNLVENLGEVFIELKSQSELIQKVIHEEEENFLRTLDKGIERFEKYVETNPNNKQIDGKFAFELYDTYGFPYDLTALLAAEKGISEGINEAEYQMQLSEQKDRSRQATKVDAGDWQYLMEDEVEEFVGYDQTETEVKLVRYRKVSAKNKEMYHLVFNITPFYPEGGGQVGDTGILKNNNEEIAITDTKKENNLIIHISDGLPKDLNSIFTAKVDDERRNRTKKNHSATHLLHEVLRDTLGKHIEQKGSLVNADHLRFDFSHFEKVSDEDLKKIEHLVNMRIRTGFALEENRMIPLSDAQKLGAMALFGEKYGDVVRVIKFGSSLELCGGTHVSNTAEIGQFKIVSEGSISAGIRRIEAITGPAADEFINGELNLLDEIRSMLKNPKDLKDGVSKLLEENQSIKSKLDALRNESVKEFKNQLEQGFKSIGNFKFVSAKSDLSADEMRDIVFQIKSTHSDAMIVLSSVQDQKVLISIGLGNNLIEKLRWSAKDLIKEISPMIHGGGGGQDQFATAGGKNVAGIDKVFEFLEGRLKI